MLQRSHEALSWIVVAGHAGVGTWALAAHRWPRVRRPVLWWSVAAAQLLTAAQVALGVALLRSAGAAPGRNHVFYGFLTLVAITVLYAYRAQLRHRLYLLYGGGSLFIMGLALRAIQLAK